MSTTLSFQSILSPVEDGSIEAITNAIESLKIESPRTEYSKLRHSREQATFNLMMRMDPSALSAIRHEFYNRDDSVALTEFIYIMSTHLIDAKLNRNEQDKRNFVSDMNELFKEVDVNGDGLMEWEEFTKFTVEKASLLNQRYVISSLPEYVDSTASLDPGMRQFRRNNISCLLPLPSMSSFAVIEEHKKAISIYHASNGSHIATIQTDAVPLAIEVMESNTIIAACSDLEIVTHQQLANKRFQKQAAWATPEAQMCLAWMAPNETVYSGAISGNIYCWQTNDRSLLSTMPEHTDICMKLLALDQLDNLISASLDTTIGVWDTYTNNVIHKLRGHHKGIFDLSYNPDYRLLFTCGFDHDAFVWSPFVNSLVFKLKGHHSSLVGVHSVDNSPEVITADEDGVFKLWDVRTFQCVQTFFNTSTIDSDEPSEHLCCFLHQQIHTSGLGSDVGESRIYAASRRIHSFDQRRVVQARTTDFTNVTWMNFNSESLALITISNRNLIVWDVLLGSKMLMYVKHT